MIWFARRKGEIFVMSAEIEDLSRLAEIHATSFNKAWGEDEIDRLASMPGVALWIAKERGRGKAGAMGFALIRNSGQEAEIITIATDPARRRYGVGRALMEHTIRELHRDRVQQLFLEVDASNLAAISLYKSLGFKQVATRKAYYSSTSQERETTAALLRDDATGSTDALVMSLDLR